MPHRNRLNAGFPDVKRVNVHRRVTDMWNQAYPRCACEGICESFAQGSAGRRVAKARQDAAESRVERLQVIDPGRVVGVKVGVENSVDTGNAFTQRLHADLWPTVNEQARTVIRLDGD